MKKIIFIMALVMSALIVNAQVTPSDRTSPSSSPSSADTSSFSKSSTGGVSVKVSDLPQSIRDNISKDYPGFTIKDASSVSGKSGLNYQVNVSKGSENETLLYDNTGKFLKKWSKSDMNHDMNKDMKKDKDNKSY